MASIVPKMAVSAPVPRSTCYSGSTPYCYAEEWQAMLPNDKDCPRTRKGVQPFTARSLARQLSGRTQNAELGQSQAMGNASEERQVCEAGGGK